MTDHAEPRHYPPLVTFHAPGCWMFGGNGTALPIDQARDAFPNHHFDVCAATDLVPYVLVEENDFGDHLYAPSDRKPDDAIRSLCRVCLGTHGGEDDREVITVKPKPTVRPGLMLPPGTGAEGEG